MEYTKQTKYIVYIIYILDIYLCNIIMNIKMKLVCMVYIQTMKNLGNYLIYILICDCIKSY